MNYTCPLCHHFLDGGLVVNSSIYHCNSELPSHYKVVFQDYSQRIEYFNKNFDSSIMIYYENNVMIEANIRYGNGEQIDVNLKSNLSIQDVITKLENLKILK